MPVAERIGLLDGNGWINGWNHDIVNGWKWMKKRMAHLISPI